MARYWPVAVVAFLFSSMASAFQPTFSSGIDLVHVSVTVIDRDGQPVAGLNAVDFELFEDDGLTYKFKSDSMYNMTFIECDPDSNSAEKINTLLLENGIIVRTLHSYGLPYCLRITIGTREEMKTTIDVLSKGNFSA